MVPLCGSLSVIVATPDPNHLFLSLCLTLITVLSGHSKRRPKLVFKTDYRLMQIKSIAEYAICNTFDLHKATICH